PSSPPPPPPPVSVPVPPPYVDKPDTLPAFKKASREFIDLARKVDAAARATPTPTYADFWKVSEELTPIYARIFATDAKEGLGAAGGGHAVAEPRAGGGHLIGRRMAAQRLAIDDVDQAFRRRLGMRLAQVRRGARQLIGDDLTVRQIEGLQRGQDFWRRGHEL